MRQAKEYFMGEPKDNGIIRFTLKKYWHKRKSDYIEQIHIIIGELKRK